MFVLEEFDKTKHSRELFICSSKELTNYLKYFANQDQKRNLAKIYVAVKKEYETEENKKLIYGYFSLSAYSLYYEEQLNINSSRYQQIPAILIGRLAIQEKQIELRGYELLGRAFQECKQISTQLGAQIVIVEALNDKTIKFYLRQGFVQLNSSPNRFYFPIKSIIM